VGVSVVYGVCNTICAGVDCVWILLTRQLDHFRSSTMYIDGGKVYLQFWV